LKPWIPWVLQGHADRDCPYSQDPAEERYCAFLTRLDLDLGSREGRFSASVRTYGDAWATIPGDSALWPQDVTVDERPGIVTPLNGVPRLWLTAGSHRITGRFVWDRLPEALTVPRTAGLLGVRVDGREVPLPAFNDQSQIWIGGSDSNTASAADEDRLELEVFRRVIDETPLQVVTHLSLHVAGQVREAVLEGSLLPGFIPLNLTSPLPARIEPNGSLRLQLRPGDWKLELAARHPGNIDRIALNAFPEPWPAKEIWAFDARNALRMVQIEGVTAIDPRQSNLPDEWKSLPAYQLAAGEVFSVRVLRRGDPEPEPDQLTLDRSLWLDFDGHGYTVSDTLGGTVTRAWRLDATPSLQLGRVSLDGQPQSITRLADNGALGVEVRRGALRLSADGRFDSGISEIPATGWAVDFQRARTILNLPPGWRLLAAGGVDQAPDTWIGRWTLLDLFVVLITTLAAGRLWSRTAGFVTLIALTLLWHEPGAPRFVWLLLLTTIALLRVLPEGRVASGVRWLRNLGWLAILIIAVPFVYHQVRSGIYPQLDRPWLAPDDSTDRAAPPASPPVPAAAAPAEIVSSDTSALADADEPSSNRILRRAKSYAGGSDLQKQATNYGEIDPGAVTQTGPGLPSWEWTRIPLSWNGPVLKDQTIRLYLLSPHGNLLASVIRVLLLAVLVALFAGLRKLPRGGLVPLFLAACWLPSPGARADFPPAAMLEQLEKRLTERPDCLPGCAEITRLRLDVSPSSLEQTLEIHALQRVLVPLPAQEGQWWPTAVASDAHPAEGLLRTQSGMAVVLEPGTHRIVLRGPLAQREQIQLPLPLVPRRVEIGGSGWTVEGVRPNGVPDSQLRLLRVSDARSENAGPESRPLDPFLQVERTLGIGLDWRVSTTVRRLSPRELPISLEIPLLAGEAVITPGLQIRNGRLSLNLPPGEESVTWDSVLEKTPEIRLRAPDTKLWTETWRADVSPLWHLESEGIPVVHHQDATGNWLPEWRPWPGEEILLRLTRPTGAPGNTLTIDNSRLVLKPGLRATEAVLSVSLRSARGTQHTVTLPDGAVLQTVQIDGTPQPIRQQQRAVTLPLHPGTQVVTLTWRAEEGIVSRFRAPTVDLGVPSVNSSIRVEPGPDRWLLLTGGPDWGPAVLYWGYLIVIAGLALLLGRFSQTPLRTTTWALLLIGLSQIELAPALIVVAWLFALGQRSRLNPEIEDNRFNLIQLGLALLTVSSLLILLHAVEQGLLGYPDMQIAGAGSTASELRWYQDRIDRELPRPWFLSVPLWIYRVAMLAWALWLAHSLLGWLRWGWGNYSRHGLWRKWQWKTVVTPHPAQSSDPWKN
jgi:hypothetical protein